MTFEKDVVFEVPIRLLTFHFPTPFLNNSEANSFSNDAVIFLTLSTSTSIIESVEAIPSTTHPRKIFPSLGSGVNLNRVPYGYSSDLFVFRISFITLPFSRHFNVY